MFVRWNGGEKRSARGEKIRGRRDHARSVVRTSGKYVLVEVDRDDVASPAAAVVAVFAKRIRGCARYCIETRCTKKNAVVYLKSTTLHMKENSLNSREKKRAKNKEGMDGCYDDALETTLRTFLGRTRPP